MSDCCSTIPDLFSGALIAIIGAVAGFGISYWRQRIDKKKDEEKQIESFLNAIKSEISILWGHYYEVVGKSIEEELKENDGFGAYYPIFDNYFVVYDNNTNLIGNLDQDLSAILVRTYIAAKGLKDSFIFNNQLLNEMKRYHDLAQESKLIHYSTQYQIYFETWKSYGSDIREMHFKLKEYKEILINNINKKL